MTARKWDKLSYARNQHELKPKWFHSQMLLYCFFPEECTFSGTCDDWPLLNGSTPARASVIHKWMWWVLCLNFLLGDINFSFLILHLQSSIQDRDFKIHWDLWLTVADTKLEPVAREPEIFKLETFGGSGCFFYKKWMVVLFVTEVIHIELQTERAAQMIC